MVSALFHSTPKFSRVSTRRPSKIASTMSDASGVGSRLDAISQSESPFLAFARFQSAPEFGSADRDNDFGEPSMKTKLYGVTLLSAATLLLVGCNVNTPAAPAAPGSTTVVPVPVPTPGPQGAPGAPAPEAGPPGAPGAPGAPAP